MSSACSEGIFGTTWTTALLTLIRAIIYILNDKWLTRYDYAEQLLVSKKPLPFSTICNNFT